MEEIAGELLKRMIHEMVEGCIDFDFLDLIYKILISGDIR